MKPAKPKPCRHCRKEFIPKRSTLEVTCSVHCAIAYARKASPKRLEVDRRKARAAEKREAVEKLRRRRDWVSLAQALVNQWVKLRDANDGCISCHMPANYQGQWHASHYRSVGAAPQLRFDLANIHKSCAQCNSFKSGNVVEYRLRLIQKIGLAEVERLENDNAIRRFDIDELKSVIALYRGKLRELTKARAA